MIKAKSLTVILITGLFIITGCTQPGFNNNTSMDGYIPGNTDWGVVENPGESNDNFDEICDNPFIKTSEENISTFSLDADSAAYSYMRRTITDYSLPNPNSVRIEEYLNYFTFDYEDPSDGATVALNSEISTCPWNKDHYLVRLGIKGKSIPESEIPLNNYVFLVDVSGSMYGDDKLELFKKGLIKMLDGLNQNDRISIVSYSGKEELVLESTLVKDKETIVQKINSLVASGCTNGSDAITMAYKEALKNYIPGGNNRIIMGTDGDFNVGITSTEALLELVQNYATQEKSVYLTCCGFGYDDLNDSMMETISNKGNGTYVYVDSEEEMEKVFIQETSRFITVANDCKAQVTFNKDLVSEYRLIGYENRILHTEDFENDKVDAAEVGAGQTITALYEIIPASNCSYDSDKKFEASLLQFDFRYKEKLNEESKLISSNPDIFTAETSENMRFAQAVAAFGMILRKSKYKGTATYDMILNELLSKSFDYDPYGRRAKFSELVAKAKSLSESNPD